MADIFDAATRSRIMRAIKSKNTKPEMALAVALRIGKPAYMSVSRATTRLPGKPDFVVHNALDATKLAVFVHGCWWHCCPRHWRAPKSGRNGGAAGWKKKFAANRRRDVRVRRHLRALGWRTMVVWEHERPASAAARVKRRLHALR